VLFLILAGVALAAPRFGNRLADSEGYGPVASRVLLLIGLTGAFPIIGSGLFVGLAGKRLHQSPALFGGAVAIAAAAWLAGTFLSFYVLFS